MLKIIGYATASLMGLLLIGGIVVQLLLAGQLKKIVVSGINERLAAPLLVNGNISFSVFRHFPFAAVDFNNVELKEGIAGSNKPLLVAQKISLQFNLLALLHGDYTLKRVTMNNAKLFAAVDANGNPNYNVFKSGNASADNARVRIQKIILNGVDVSYADATSRQSYNFRINDGKASGDFSASNFTTDVSADLFVTNTTIQDVNYLDHKPASLALALNVDLQNVRYTFERCRLKVSDAVFQLRGSVARAPKGFATDLFMSSDAITFETLGSLLPEAYASKLKNWKTTGNLSCTGTVNGILSNKENPSVEFRFDVKNATLHANGSDQRIGNMNMNAVYSNGKDKTWNGSQLVVNNASMQFDNRPFVVSMALHRFDHPTLDLKLSGDVNLATVGALTNLDRNVQLIGSAHLENFSYHGSPQNLQSKNAAAQSQGTVTIRDAAYRNGNINIGHVNATMSTDGNNLDIQSLNATFGQTALSVNGSVQNLIPGVLQNFSPSSPQLVFNLNTNAERFDVNDFLFGGSDASTSSNPWWKRISGQVNFKTNDFCYNDFEARNMQASVHESGGILRFNGLRFYALQGSATANGLLDLSRNDAIMLEATLACNAVDVTLLFRSFRNFSQDAITADNLAGKLSTNCYVKAVWRNGKFMSNEMMAMADVTINGGELNKFKPMYALSKFAKVQDLENIRFSKLSNQIEIRNGVVRIPTTTINTNVLTVEMSGTHTLDNIIDYRLKLNCMQLVTGKFKRSSTFDPDAAETNANGTMSLYILMRGPASNPTISYDKLAVKQVIKQNVALEKTTFKDALKKEFGKTTDDQPQQTKEWKAQQTYELIDFDASADTSK